MKRKHVIINLSPSSEVKSTYELYVEAEPVVKTEFANENIDSIIAEARGLIEQDAPDAIIVDTIGVGSYIFEELTKLSLPVMTDADFQKKLADEATEKKRLEDEEAEKKRLEDEAKDKGITKNLGQLVRKEFHVSIKELKNGHLEAIVNSGQEDRHGEVLDMKGLDIKKYMTNPILANGHDYSKYSVGRTLKLSKTSDGQLVAEFIFATDIENYDDPKILDALYRKGYQFAFSIGFIAREIDGNVYTKSEMIEFSPVLIGADAQALLKSKELLVKKGIDIGQPSNYDLVSKHMKTLKDILAKIAAEGIEALTVGEIKLLNAEKEDLTPAQVKELSSVLEADATGDEDIKKELADLKKEIETIKANETVIMKDINVKGKGKKDGEVSKELKFLAYVRGVKAGNFSELEDLVGKDAMNTSGNVVLPPVEFIAEVERLEDVVGVARKYARIKSSTSGNGVKYLLGDDDLEIFDTAEGGAKKSTKLTYAEKVLTWRKFAGILPVTDELSEDSAIDLWNDATRRFARAYARKEDILVFTETTGSGKNPGVMEVSGTNVVVIDGDSIEDAKYDDFTYALNGVPTLSQANGVWFLNREVLGVVQRIKDDQGRPIFQRAMADGTPATILGKPYELVDVLPKLSDDAPNTKFIAFGNLDYVTLGQRTDLSLKMFDSGIVGDPDEEDQDANTLNLLTQDMQALRAVKRMNAIVRFPAAFSIISTGESQS